MRYFLVDRVTALEPGRSAEAVKAVTLTDEVLHDHFPDYPVMPGLLVLEGAAQLAGFLLEVSCNPPGAAVRRAVLVQVEEAKFHDTVGPGEVLHFAVRVDSLLDAAGRVVADVDCGGRRIARARLTFALREVRSERLAEQRRQLYALWTRDLASCPALP